MPVISQKKIDIYLIYNVAVKKEKVDSFSYNLKVTGTEFCNELKIEDK